MTPGFTCRHVHLGAPILRAVRDEPLDENDSGWALVCGADHMPEEFMIVDLDRYVSRDMSLVELLDLPPYTVAVRVEQDQPWVIETRGLPLELEN